MWTQCATVRGWSSLVWATFFSRRDAAYVAEAGPSHSVRPELRINQKTGFDLSLVIVARIIAIRRGPGEWKFEIFRKSTFIVRRHVK